MLQHPFKPIVFKGCKVLILGSFPSVKSFENSFYYANPKNQFWKILSEISGYPINNRDQKLWLLKELKFGLWDVIKSCRRENSSDSNLKDTLVNNIESTLQDYTTIELIAFTSKLAQKLYNQNFSHLNIDTIYLPSPSPAYAALSLEKKAYIYKESLEEYL